MAAQNGPYPAPFQTSILLVPAAGAGNNAEHEAQQLDLSLLLPASSRSKIKFNDRDMVIIKRAISGTDYLKTELSVTQLNKIHDDLWLAGRPMPPRSLNYQVASSRAITLAEDIQLHLVWEPGRIFLKPLPRYLLSRQFWEERFVCREQQNQQTCSCFNNPQAGIPVAHGEVCERRELYECAYGFLLSYAALIQYESDYQIAISQHLLPGYVTWEAWRKLAWELLEHSPANMARVNKRYRFGELRIGRLNKIVRVRGLLAAGTGLRDLMRGYKFEFATYGQQLEGYLAPVLAATAYILLVLTAMQVGLGTETLRENASFQRASYGFTVFSILAPLIVFTIIIVIVLIFVVFNYQATKTFLHTRMEFYDSLHADH